MALRSLIFNMKAVPRGVPAASRAFTKAARKPDPKLMNNPWSKIAAELRDTSKYRSPEDLRRAIGTLMEKELKPISERHEKELGNLRAAAGLVMAGVVLLISHK
ncbi:hypothetical protein U9M48_025266 [Paspalum notatum var. saurae]|uniref:Uncharacterized protein n=1 Tax=Paspalum notatum var. saurae TaxID=547442 RepID=A0AAQ3WY49_PASNO